MLLLAPLLLLAQPQTALRFNVGDRVQCHVENDAWEPGTVFKLRHEHGGHVVPYVVELDMGDTVIAPVDDDRYIRAPGARESSGEAGFSARLLRFAVGSRVECNMGMYWERGSVIRLNYQDPRDLSAPAAPYQVQLDSGDLVFAPHDDEDYIRREGSILMSDPALRFRVGDRVECNPRPDSDSSGKGPWATGRVVALHYHEPRFGEGVTAPYQASVHGPAHSVPTGLHTPSGHRAYPTFTCGPVPTGEAR